MDEYEKNTRMPIDLKGKSCLSMRLGDLFEFGDYLGFRLFDRVVAQKQKDFK
jgi:hypothetical protein